MTIKLLLFVVIDKETMHFTNLYYEYYISNSYNTNKIHYIHVLIGNESVYPICIVDN